MTTACPRHLLRRLSTREGLENPHPIYTALREAGAVHDAPCFGPALTRYADARETLFDRSLQVSAASAKSGSARARIGERMPADLQELPPWLFLMDEPDHTRLRKIIAPVFAQSSIDALKASIARNARTLLRALGNAAQFDLVADYAVPLPLFVIGDLLGVGADEREQLRAWSEALVYKLHALASPERYSEAVDAHRGLADFFRARLRVRRQRPASDVLTLLANAQSRGDLNEDEAVSLAVNLLVAGHLTTADLIASLCLLLLRNAPVLRQLRENSSLWPKAVEEALRLEPPTPLLARVYAHPVYAHGRAFDAGDCVNIFIAAANRDPAAFHNPDEFDLGRRSRRHLSFGGGAHFCLGAPLARAEAEIACRLLFSRFDNLSLAGEVAWRVNPNFRGPTQMPVARPSKDLKRPAAAAAFQPA